jgi:hypothetical protein
LANSKMSCSTGKMLKKTWRENIIRGNSSNLNLNLNL